MLLINIRKFVRGGINLRALAFQKNKGLGEALKTAVKQCSHELIARMDRDDIAVKNRFELQLEKFVRDPQISICGGQISEFIDEPSNIVGRRIVPEADREIKTYMKKRCPFNYMTVMFKNRIFSVWAIIMTGFGMRIIIYGLEWP